MMYGCVQRERESCVYMASYAKGLSMAVDLPTGNPSLTCLQLVDILHRVRIPDWACELQRWPNQGFVCLLLDGHGAHLPVPPQEPESC